MARYLMTAFPYEYVTCCLLHIGKPEDSMHSGYGLLIVIVFLIIAIYITCMLKIVCGDKELATTCNSDLSGGNCMVRTL